ncbi:poly-beta-1,6-N-acetyl-D-glucosamine biosynthesis protein PgaD [Lysobacter sp. cf310]|uniref:poly-beta-1,6-N-acetyl-D-glucosamine biosynthesis protein PgaD n=1 Tax=Lysobacter sp. cf310 TaxID=1761790 RepID=UPI0008E48635|nr:poly-beta-1,6-N-acetyl-D-glucosamine biosynthesis protein PgaD [Lysobacter sp. cf310]SFK72045.1 biofilm PGA synthesis protein PgaD [Lysobacter sp. cf310]
MNTTQERRNAAAKFDSRLIQKRRSQPRLRRTAWGFVTAVFWGMYVYLWMPVITFLLWVLGIRNAYFELYLREHRVEPFLLIALPSLALCAAVLLIAWAEYNRWRFSGKDRRGAPPSAQLDEIARALGADVEIGAALNAGRVVVLNMDAQAIPRGVRNVLAPVEEVLIPA